MDTALALPFPLTRPHETARPGCPTDEVEWARAAAAGDKASFARLVEKHREREAEPGADEQAAEGPAHLGAVVAGPQDDQGRQDAAGAGEQRHQKDAVLVSKVPVPGARGTGTAARLLPGRHSPCRCRRR